VSATERSCLDARLVVAKLRLLSLRLIPFSHALFMRLRPLDVPTLYTLVRCRSLNACPGAGPSWDTDDTFYPHFFLSLPCGWSAHSNYVRQLSRASVPEGSRISPLVTHSLSPGGRAYPRAGLSFFRIVVQEPLLATADPQYALRDDRKSYPSFPPSFSRSADEPAAATPASS